MIVLVNPWSTPSPKKPLPMSLLALRRAARRRVRLRDRRRQPRSGCRSTTIVDLAARTPLTAIGVTVMPGPQLRHAVALLATLEGAAARRADRLGRLLSVAARRRLPARCGRRLLRARTGRAVVCRADARLAGGRIARRHPRAELPPATATSSRRRSAPLVRRSTRCRRGPTSASRCDATSIGTTSASASARTTRRSAVRSPAASARSSALPNRRWVAESPDRVGSGARALQTATYGADAVQFHDMDFFISEPRTRGDRRSHLRALGHDVVGARPRRRADALPHGHVGGDEARAD